MLPTTPADNEFVYKNHSKIVPIVISMALFMETLDSTIINSTIPAMARDFHRSPVDLKVALTSYLVSLAIFIPISGWLADKFSTKTIITIGISTFGIGSFLCGMSNSLEALVIFRIIQGIGGALMMPVARLILLKTFSKSQLVAVTNYATIPSLIGPALGPVLGGVIATYYHWSWIFFINVPFCILLLILVRWETKGFQNEKVTPLDFTGFILFTSGLGALTFTLECISEDYMSIHISLLLLAASILLLFSYWYKAKDNPYPIVNTQLFKIKSFALTSLGGLISRMAVGGIPFLIPLLLQVNHAFSPVVSGLLTIPCIVGMMLTKFFVKPIVKRLGFKTTILVNTMLLSFSILSMILLVRSHDYFLITTLMFMHGLVLSMQFSCLNILLYVDVGEALMSQGTSLGSTIQQLSMSFGVVFVAFLLKNPYVMQAHILSNHSFIIVFCALSLLLLSAFLIFMQLDKDAGHQASGHTILRN